MIVLNTQDTSIAGLACYRIAEHQDIAGVLALQERNLVTKLSEQERKNGFVTTPFTAQQLQSLIDIQGLFVVQMNEEISGYAAAAGWDYFVGRPMFELMLSRFRQIQYRGIAIDEGNSFQYGPFCIATEYRGSDAFPQLFSMMRQHLSYRYKVGTTFINRLNFRSLRAHVDKVGLDIIDEFTFNGNEYMGLAFLTDV